MRLACLRPLRLLPLAVVSADRPTFRQCRQHASCHTFPPVIRNRLVAKVREYQSWTLLNREVAWRSRSRDLLSKGYFPGGLPPPFTTETFGNTAGDLDQGFESSGASLACQSRSARGGLRRTLAIPNPEAQIRVATCMAENWAATEEVL